MKRLTTYLLLFLSFANLVYAIKNTELWGVLLGCLGASITFYAAMDIIISFQNQD